MDEVGCWQSEEDRIGKTFEDYHVNLFSTSHLEISEELIHFIHWKVSDPMNILLSRDFWASEVESALKQMYATSALGPNEIPPIFYQEFWPTVSPIVTKTVLDFLNLGITPPNFNEAHIVLIPKVKDPKRVTDFRPISLCNVANKIASKTMANRLK